MNFKRRSLVGLDFHETRVTDVPDLVQDPAEVSIRESGLYSAVKPITLPGDHA